MLESSFSLGKIAGIRIGVHYTWFIIFAMMSFSLSLLFREYHPDWGGAEAMFTAVITSLLFFVSIILHELGHSIVAIARGIPVRSITLFIFGGVAQTEKDSDSAATEFKVAIAGPLVSFALAVLFYVLRALAAPYSVHVEAACDWLVSINLAVAIFNLLPGFPLDGGRVFRAIVWGWTGNAVRGMQWAVASGRLVAFALLGLGLFVMYTGLILNGLWLAAIGWFLLNAAQASARDFTLNRLLRGVTVGDIMLHEVPMVPGDLQVMDWIDHHVLRKGLRAFLVQEHGEVVGLATLSDVNKIPREEWGTTPLRRIMTPASELHVVSPKAGFIEVLHIMQHHSIQQVPVMERGKIRGWIDQDRLLRTMQLHTQLGR